MRKPLLSSEILASRLAFGDHVYVVGPFAHRVSFSSQQRRSMSLVCDINEDFTAAGDEEGLKKKKVCVVGAGIAGLTCAATAAALGASVYLYEKSAKAGTAQTGDPLELGEVLPTIREAMHRDAHPSLNFWPYEPVEPFTRLPILNWHESDCEDVSKQIVRQMNALISGTQVGQQIIGVRNGCTVTGIKSVPRPGRDPQWKLDVDLAPGAQSWNTAFDVVIFALGFGSEKSAPGVETPSYWMPVGDAAGRLSLDPSSEIDHYVVSGTGDGGLIEALRLTFKHRRPGNTDDETLQALAKPEIIAAVSAVENRAYKIYVDHILHGPGGPLPFKVRNQIAETIWTGYNKLLDDWLSDQAIQALRRKRSDIQPVKLLGRYLHPMELSASPYHRLLTAIACAQGWIEYTQIARVDATVRPGKVPVGRGARTLEIELADVLATLPAPAGGSAATVSFQKAFFVARHGYSSPLEDLWPNRKKAAAPGNPTAPAGPERPSTRVRQVSHQQSLYADQDRLRPDYAREIAKAFGKPDPADALALYKDNRTAIDDYFDKRFGVGLRVLRGNPPRFALDGTRVTTARTALPMTLYGCELKDRSNPAPIKDFQDQDVDDGL